MLIISNNPQRLSLLENAVINYCEKSKFLALSLSDSNRKGLRDLIHRLADEWQ